MSSSVEKHVMYQLANAPIREYPYPHFYLKSIFPPEYFEKMLAYWPSSSELISLPSTGRVPKGQYEARHILLLSPQELLKLPREKMEFWSDFRTWLLGRPLIDLLVDKFLPHITKLRFDMSRMNYSLRSESLVVRDHTHYKIGPHTDAPHRLLSMLFYCPKDATHPELGTSIYTPIDPEFTCEGGPHHPFDGFDKLATMPFVPNSAFCFLKTDKCFHGVGPVDIPDIERDLILYDIRIEKISQKAEAESAPLSERLLSGLLKGRF